MNLARLHVRAVAAALLGLLVVPVPQRCLGTQFVYVNNNAPAPNNSVTAFLVAQTGALQLVAGSPFLTGGGGSFTPHVGAVSLVTSSNYLYATNSGTDTVAAFNVNADGTLTPIPGSPFPTLGVTPVGLAVNDTGTLLFAANVFSGTVSVFSIASNGALSLVQGSPFAVSTAPLDIGIDSATSLLFVSHSIFGIGVYTIGAGGTSLAPVPGSPFAAGGGERGLAVSPEGTQLYAADGAGGSVSGFNIAGGGALVAMSGSPFAAGTGPTDVAFHPSLDVLYVSNDGSSNVSAYDIAPLTGTLSPIPGSPFASGGNGTSGMVIDPNGARLFAVNGGTSGTPGRNVSVFSIAGNGALTPVAGSPFATGVANGTPGALALLSLPTPDCTAEAPGVCITASGSTGTDCYMESNLEIKGGPSVNFKKNLPNKSISCQNGNPNCDVDGDATDDRCTFNVRLCINNEDPRLPDCSPEDVDTVEILRPRVGAKDATDAANNLEFQKAMGGGSCSNGATRSCLTNADCSGGGLCNGAPVIGVSIVDRGSTLVAGNPTASPNLCSNVMRIEIPLRQSRTGFKTGRKVFKTRATSTSGASDLDSLKLTCVPAP